MQAVLASPAQAVAGDLDLSFGPLLDGKVTTSFGLFDDRALGAAIQVQADGKIVAAGQTWNGANYDFALARYNTDGTLDSSFDVDGKVTTDLGSTDDVVRGVAIQGDKIVAAGFKKSGANYDFALARYNRSDGSLDTSFGTGGKVTTDFGSGDIAYGVAIQSDSKIVAAGVTGAPNYGDFALARYNTDGSLDTSFDIDGKVTTDFGSLTDDLARGVAIQGDGKIVVAGTTLNGNWDFALARYDSNGSLDGGFGAGGKVTTAIGRSTDDTAYGVAIQGDQRIVAAGETKGSKGGNFALARYKTTGSVDTTFDRDGEVVTDIGSTADLATSLAIQADGKIVAAGRNSSDFALARYTTAGKLDTGFSGDGKVTTNFGSTTEVANGVAIQATDGRIVAVGYKNAADADFALARYLPN